MIPVLYNDEIDDLTNMRAIARLGDCISCEVVSSANSEYELELEYPINGKYMAEISAPQLIGVEVPDGTFQYFRTYKVEKSIGGRCNVYAQHISYYLNYVLVKPFTCTFTRVVDVLLALISNEAVADGEQHSFLYSSTWVLDEAVTYEVTKMQSVRACLIELVSLIGGQLKWDNKTLYFEEEVGQYNGVTIAYGKNVSSEKSERDLSNYVQAYLGYWSKDGVTVTATSYAYNPDVATSVDAYTMAKPLDLTGDFDTQPEEIDLYNRAVEYAQHDRIGSEIQNLDIGYINLAETDDYKDILANSNVSLYDIVRVMRNDAFFTSQNTYLTVIKVVYDVLQGRYSSIELGTPKLTLAKKLAEVEKEASNDSLDTAQVQEIVDNTIESETDTSNTSGTLYDRTYMDDTTTSGYLGNQTNVNNNDGVLYDRDTIDTKISQMSGSTNIVSVASLPISPSSNTLYLVQGEIMVINGV